jgi:hypothetical protein
MLLTERRSDHGHIPKRRRYARCEILCRAKIRIGNRVYAGYIHNISPAGAKLRTITPIRGAGAVILTLPDLPPIRCRLRWSDGNNAGVEFARTVAALEFSEWVGARLGLRHLDRIAELTELV